MSEAPQPFHHTLGDGVNMTRGELFEHYRDVGSAKNWLYDWHGLNEWLFLKINSLRGEYYDMAIQFLTQLGNYRLFPYYLGGIFLVALADIGFRKIRRKGGVRPRMAMWFGIFLVLVIGFALNGLMVRTVKDAMDYPRPYVALAQENINLLQTPKADDDMHSFPSGHVAFITFLIISLWPAFPERWKFWPLLPIAIMAWTRVSVGMHFPADTLGAFLMTSLLIIAFRRALYTLLRKLFGLVC
jgi:membrane-associated phospholipid phosphatase